MTNTNEEYEIVLFNKETDRAVSYDFEDRESAKRFIRRQQARHNWRFGYIERACRLWTRVMLYRTSQED